MKDRGNEVNSGSTLLLVLTLVIPAASAFAAEDPPDLAAIPRTEEPLEVWISFSLVNITAVNEKEETIEFDAMIHMSWMDPRLAYDPAEYGMAEGEFTPGDYSKTPRRVYLTDFAVKELFPGWWPSVVIPNGIGDRNTTNLSLGVWPDGRVGYAETFDATAETPMELRRFPFDKQALEVFIHPFVYDRDELVLVPQDRLARSWNQNMGIAEWTRSDLTMTERPVEIGHFDGSKTTISEFVISIGLDRQPMHVLVSLVLPLVLLVWLTFSVFWMDQEGLSDRVNIQFIGILSVVAYYFVILDSVPDIDYLTLIDAFIIISFFMPAAGVVISLVVDKLNRRGRTELGDKVDRVCRWAFPLGYAAACFGTWILFFGIG
ncbi:MAG: hypothetical protein KJO40_00030 [Deltaproteobacteria bacterium]|nr:hypothetical protein [Deltaproteobacteria bacterium]NND27672.1 hypothetical protein [Myxococcales bacterium]